MKTKLAFGLLVVITTVSVIVAYRATAHMSDKLAMANALGRIQGCVSSRNYDAAYDMLSSDVKEKLSLATFTARDNHGSMTAIITSSDLTMGVSATIRGTRGELWAKYSASFGTVFYFVKEDGHWHFTDRTTGYETLSW